MKKKITLHPFENNHSVRDLHFSLEEKDQSFQVDFSFPFYKNVNTNLSKKNSQWGLWNHDVFEIFVQKRKAESESNNPYTEFQLSPLNQYFILEILKKRELYYTPLKQPFSFQSTVQDHWVGEIQFPKDRDFDYYFNFTVIQGASDTRNHYASCGDYKKPADFHCPHLFKKYF